LAAGLRPNPLGELTALPQTLYLDSEGKGREGRDRPAHFLVASAAYVCSTWKCHGIQQLSRKYEGIDDKISRENAIGENCPLLTSSLGSVGVQSVLQLNALFFDLRRIDLRLSSQLSSQ